MNNDRPETMNLGQIADRVGRSTSWLRDVRNRDDRFPAPDADGRYDLHAVAIIIGVRALEKMADDDYLTELRHHAREMIAELESARWNFLAGEHRAELVEYLRATLTNGRTARQRAIDGSLERLRQISAPHNAERATQQERQVQNEQARRRTDTERNRKRGTDSGGGRRR